MAEIQSPMSNDLSRMLHKQGEVRLECKLDFIFESVAGIKAEQQNLKEGVDSNRHVLQGVI